MRIGLDETEVAERHFANESIFDLNATLDEKITCIMQRETLYGKCKDEIGEAIMQELRENEPIPYTVGSDIVDKYYNKLLER